MKNSPMNLKLSELKLPSFQKNDNKKRYILTHKEISKINTIYDYVNPKESIKTLENTKKDIYSFFKQTLKRFNSSNQILESEYTKLKKKNAEFRKDMKTYFKFKEKGLTKQELIKQAEKPFVEITEKYRKKGLNVPNLTMNRNLFNKNPLYMDGEDIFNYYFQLSKDSHLAIGKEDKKLKFLKKENKIVEKEKTKFSIKKIKDDKYGYDFKEDYINLKNGEDEDMYSQSSSSYSDEDLCQEDGQFKGNTMHKKNRGNFHSMKEIHTRKLSCYGSLPGSDIMTYSRNQYLYNIYKNMKIRKKMAIKSHKMNNYMKRINFLISQDNDYEYKFDENEQRSNKEETRSKTFKKKSNIPLNMDYMGTKYNKKNKKDKFSANSINTSISRSSKKGPIKLVNLEQINKEKRNSSNKSLLKFQNISNEHNNNNMKKRSSKLILGTQNLNKKDSKVNLYKSAINIRDKIITFRSGNNTKAEINSYASKNKNINNNSKDNFNNSNDINNNSNDINNNSNFINNNSNYNNNSNINSTEFMNYSINDDKNSIAQKRKSYRKFNRNSAVVVNTTLLNMYKNNKGTKGGSIVYNFSNKNISSKLNGPTLLYQFGRNSMVKTNTSGSSFNKMNNRTESTDIYINDTRKLSNNNNMSTYSSTNLINNSSNFNGSLISKDINQGNSIQQQLCLSSLFNSAVNFRNWNKDNASFIPNFKNYFSHYKQYSDGYIERKFKEGCELRNFLSYIEKINNKVKEGNVVNTWKKNYMRQGILDNRKQTLRNLNKLDYYISTFEKDLAKSLQGVKAFDSYECKDVDLH